MEQKYNTSTLESELARLREYCEQKGEVIDYRKGEQLEREGDPARWLAYVERGCFKYVTRGISGASAGKGETGTVLMEQIYLKLNFSSPLLVDTSVKRL